MKDDIVSIPISEVFEPRDGCPICRMRDMLEERVIEYIIGAAMMEPDVRQETNRRGFCIDHYHMMMKKRNRLSLALILESHLNEIDSRVFGTNAIPFFGKRAKKQAADGESAADSCFVCEQITVAIDRMLANLCRLWENERDFRALFGEQTDLCLPHFSLLVKSADRAMSKNSAPEFSKAAAALCRESLATLRNDVSHFCRMFDYRNTGSDADWGNSRDSIERAVKWLTSRE